jgi:hypothetical protein
MFQQFSQGVFVHLTVQNAKQNCILIRTKYSKSASAASDNMFYKILQKKRPLLMYPVAKDAIKASH